jgi:hypothetical protein
MEFGIKMEFDWNEKGWKQNNALKFCWNSTGIYNLGN